MLDDLIHFVALMVSAIVQTTSHSISLYNTIIVLYLCYLPLICELMLAIGSIEIKSLCIRLRASRVQGRHITCMG
jgi:hypothetical protein